MTLRRLTPQPPAYVAWENALTDELGDALELCRSDAQGIVEAQADAVADAWRRRLDPKTIAAILAEAATGMTSGGAAG